MCQYASSQLKNANMIIGSPQGLKNVPSGHPGQVDFPTGQVEF